MGQLFFKKPLQIAILEGRKRTTIRRWDRPRVRAGHEAYAPGVGWLGIDAVDPVQLDELAEADAAADGFNSLESLRAMLESLYPDQDSDGKQWFRVRFTLRRRSDDARPARATGRRAGSVEGEGEEQSLLPFPSGDG